VVFFSVNLVNAYKVFLKAMISFRPFGVTFILPYLQVQNKIIIREKKSLHDSFRLLALVWFKATK